MKKNKERNDKIFKAFLFVFVIIIVFVAILFNNTSNNVIVKEKEDVIMYYFYLNTCPHCKEQEEFHKKLINKYPKLKIVEYEMSKSESRKKYINLTNSIDGLEGSKIATPTTIIGNQYNVGYLNDAITGKKIENMIEKQIQINKNNDNQCNNNS